MLGFPWVLITFFSKLEPSNVTKNDWANTDKVRLFCGTLSSVVVVMVVKGSLVRNFRSYEHLDSLGLVKW